MTNSLLSYITFSYMEGIGPVLFSNLLSYFKSVEKAYAADSHTLIEVLGSALANKFISFRDSFDIQTEVQMFQQKNITVLTREDNRFPQPLLQIPDPPICLYVKGNIEGYNFEKDIYIAVVGTRKPTPYGEQITRTFAYELAEQGIVIVSGLALGIDAIAHKATLDAGGRTIAFLGCGVNITYPAANRLIFNQIIHNNGLIISEFPPNMRAQPGLFVQRNRLISGLSRGILVSEGLKDSGSLITARYAAQQGKDVFAPPAPITSELSAAPNLLLKEGAKLVTSSKDILEEYNLELQSVANKIDALHLNEEEVSIYNLLLQQPSDTDEIARKLNTPVYSILTTITVLEIKGVIIKKGGVYRVH